MLAESRDSDSKIHAMGVVSNRSLSITMIGIGRQIKKQLDHHVLRRSALLSNKHKRVSDRV